MYIKNLVCFIFTIDEMSEPRLSELLGDLQSQGNHWGQVSFSGPHRENTTPLSRVTLRQNVCY